MNRYQQLLNLATNNAAFIAEMKAFDPTFELPNEDKEESFAFCMTYYGWLIGTKNTEDLKEFSDIVNMAVEGI